MIKNILKKKLSKYFINNNNDKGFVHNSIITNLNRFVDSKEQLQYLFFIFIGSN